MKGLTIAAAAALLGAVAAQDTEWAVVTTPEAESKTPVAKTTPEAETKTTPAAESSTWSEWETTTSKTPEAKSTTTEAQTWSEWSTTSKTPEAKSTTTTSAENVWGQWSSTTSKTPEAKSTTTTSGSKTWSEWSTTSKTPEAKSTTTTSKVWSEWETTSSKPVEVTSSETWSEWVPGTTTLTSYTTQYSTVTVYNGKVTGTWSEWQSSSTPAAASSGTWAEWQSSSVKTPEASSTGQWTSWVAPSADVNGCKMEVSVSYGQPVWVPTPSPAAASSTGTWSEWASSSTPVEAKSSASQTWSEWASSSTPVEAKSSASQTWSEWASTSTPVEVKSTASQTWSEWVSTSTPVEVKSTASQTWSEWASTSTPVEVKSTASETWSVWSSSSAAPAKPTGKSNSGSNGSGTGITTNGNKFGMTYSLYTADSQCKDQATVNADVAKMAKLGFTTIRVYSTDCHTLEYVGAACKEHNMKVILGVFISNTGIAAAQPQVDAIAKWAQWDIVELIVVGNEAVFNNYCTAGELAGFISSSRTTFKNAGYNGYISTTDELGIWQSAGSAWCDAVDVVTANLYAFFNPNTRAEDAGSFIQSEIEDLSKICPGKDVYVMESGWPSAGQCNGVACPSPENQATAIKSIQSAVGAKIIYFSFENELWKPEGKFGVEQSWGCANVFDNSWGSY